MEVIERYGAANDSGNVAVARRYYFLIDEDGTLIWKNVAGGLIPVESLIAELTEVVSGD